MNDQSLIKAFQQVFRKFTFNSKPGSFSEDFAQKRYLKKMQEPDLEVIDSLKQKCWDEFITFDRSLPLFLRLPRSHWYKARSLLHEWLRAYRLTDDIDFPRGSSCEPTRGRNSIAQYLSRNAWSCTSDNFDNFVEIVRSHKSLRRAFRRRYHRFLSKNKFDKRSSDRLLWERIGNADDIFRWKMARITHIVRGSRFSSVPKNNQSRRPINIEPFGNLLAQRRIGNSIRDLLARLGQDLDRVASAHRVRISNLEDATIDLSNASDSVSMALVRFLFPRWFVEQLESTRSFMLFGGDGHYHVLRKVSSMGNGYTFELMTLIIYALCQTYDSNSSVFGDDIIINRRFAEDLIKDLEDVGFKVNIDKSFISGPFRESCGANFHESEGYIESYDFLWPSNIHDCAVLYNKAKALASNYPSFEPLEKSLVTHIPSALRGGASARVEQNHGPDEDPKLDVTFNCGTSSTLNRVSAKYEKILKRNLCISGSVHFHYGYTYKPILAQPRRRRLSSANWDQYEMYLYSGRVCKDVITGDGSWERCLFVCYNGESRRFSPSELTSQ